LGWRSAAKYR